MTSRLAPRRVGALAFLAFAIAAFTPVTGRPAAAQSACGGPAPITVEITSPRGSVVSGSTVSVRGTAAVLTGVIGNVTHVEASLAGRSNTQSFDGGPSADFDIPIDTAGVAPGQATLTVRACGPLSSGSTSMPVTVQPAAQATTTSAPRATTTVPTRPGDVVAPTTTTAAGAPTTVAAAGAPAVTGSSTTTATSPPTTTASGEGTSATRPPASRPEPVRPRTGGDSPLVLSDSSDDGSPGAPLWVGAVVGVSGGLGLLFSAASWRRRTTRLPEPAEPVDPDLVEVG